MGSGEGDIEPWQLAGTNYGYAAGGYISSASNVIEKFTFASDANSSDVGDLSTARYDPAGQSSSSHGYSSGGTS